MKVALAGSKEPIAQYISQFFKNKGHEVFFILKNPSGEGDFSFEQIEKNGLAECDVLINLPEKKLIENRKGAAFLEKEFFDTRIRPTQILKESLLKSPHPPKLFISFSSVGCYPKTKEQFYNEDGQIGTDLTATLIQKWEEAAKLPQEAQTRTVLLRLGLVIMSSAGLLSKILPYFKVGMGATMGTGTEPFSWIYMKDLYWILDYAIQHEEFEGVYNAISPQLINSRDFSRALARVMKKPLFFKFSKRFLYKRLGDTADLVFSKSRVFPSKLLKSGFEFRYPAIYCALVDCLSKGSNA